MPRAPQHGWGAESPYTASYRFTHTPKCPTPLRAPDQDTGTLGEVLAEIGKRCAAKGLEPPPPHFVRVQRLLDPRQARRQGAAAAPQA